MDQKIKKLGVNSTVVLTSLSLVACGGGGSDGYYNQNSGGNTNNGGNQSNTDASAVPESLTVTLQDVEGKVIQSTQDNRKVQFAVKVLNANKGGVSAKDVRLDITDAEKIGVTSISSKVTSNEAGIALFELDIPSLQTENGKVQLTATVDGTTIKQVYTLNISKTSTLVSDYNITVAQGVVLNLPKGSAEVTVQVKDSKGLAKAGQTVVLTLPEKMQSKFSTSSASVSTDENGAATFAITANQNLTVQEIAEFVNSSQTLNFLLIDENQAEKKATTALTFKDISSIVNTLDVIVPENALTILNGKTTTPAKVKVYAKNSLGDVLKNTKIKLQTDKLAYGVKLNTAEATTNDQGYAEYELSIDTSHPVALKESGINLTATYTDETNQEIKGNATLQVVDAADAAQAEQAIQRLEIASSYKINASNDTVTITVKGVNNKGAGATTGDVTLTLNAEATANGVTFEGSEKKSFTTENAGYVTYTLKTGAKTQAAIDALITSGIVATFTSNNAKSNEIKIAVEKEGAAVEPVKYLLIDPINETFDPSKDQKVSIKVKAVGEKGSALIGERISIKSALSDSQLTTLNLSLIGQAERSTGEDGTATFEFDYKYNKTTAQQELAKQGVTFTTTALSNAKTQSVKVNFNAQSTVSKVVLDYFTVDTAGTAEIELNKEHEIAINVKAMGVDGKILAGQSIAIGIDDTAISNGVSYGSATNIASDVQGNVSFKLKVKASNQAELETLLNNGVTVAVVAKRDDGSDYRITRKILLTVPVEQPSTDSKVDYLIIDPIITAYDYTKDQTIEVKVKALDVNGSPLANEKLKIKSVLSNADLAKLNLSLAGAAEQTTDATGYATFVFNYKYANTAEQIALAKSGVTLVAASANVKEASLKLNFKAPVEESVIDLDYFTITTNGQVIASTDVDSEISINVNARGTDGKILANQEVSIGIDDTAISNGISYLTATKLKTDANGNLVFKLKVRPENRTQLASLLVSGVTVAVKAIRKDGSEYTVLRSVELVEKAVEVNVQTLLIDPILTAYDYTQDQTIAVRVKALGNDGGILSNATVRLESLLTSAQMATLNLSLNGAAEVQTDASGYATFSLSYKYNKTDAQKVLALATTGIPLQAVASNGKTQTAALYFVEQKATQILDRVQIVSAEGQKAIALNTTTDIKVDVIAYDSAGQPIKDQVVAVNLDDLALSNGASISGASSVKTDANGRGQFIVSVSPQNTAELDHFLQNGLTVKVQAERADGSTYLTQRQVTLTQATTEAQVQAVLIDPILASYDYQQDHSIAIRVKALGEAGKSLANAKVSISSLTAAELAKLNLSIVGDTSKITDETGYATFSLEYKYNSTIETEERKADKEQLLKGVRVAVSSNAKTSTAVINFKPATATVDLDYLTVDTAGYQVIGINKETEFTVTVNAVNTDGQPMADGQKITLGFPDSAKNSGLSLVSASTLTVKDGQVTFVLKAYPRNASDLAELAKGIAINIQATRADDSRYSVDRVIDFYTSETQAPASIDYLIVDPLATFNPKQDQTIAVKVKALASDGSILRNEKVRIETTLSSADLIKLNLSLNGAAEQYTDDNGYATFEFSYKYDEKSTTQQGLAKTGVALKVISANGKEQFATINFNTPSAATTLDYLVLETQGRLTVAEDTSTSLAVSVFAKDVLGGALANQVVAIELDEAALANGVSFSKGTQATTQGATGVADFELTVYPRNAAELEYLLSNGVTIRVTAQRADGSRYVTQRKVEVVQADAASKVEALLIDPILNSFDYTKDQTITVRAKALGAGGQSLVNEKISISQLALASDPTKELTATDLAALNLSLVGSSSQFSDASGYATFTFDYKYSGQAAQDAIKAGLIITAKANEQASAKTTLNFRDAIVNGNVVLDYLSVTTGGNAVVEAKKKTTLTMTAKAMGTDGLTLAGQKVRVEFDDSIPNKGVTFDSKTTVDTDDKGVAEFSFSVLAENDTELAALLESGVTVKIIATRADGSEYTVVRKVDLYAKQVEVPSNVDTLLIDPIVGSLDYTQNQSVAIRVKALATDGSALANEIIRINELSVGTGADRKVLTNTDLANLNLSLVGQAERRTDDTGYATFVFEYKYSGNAVQKDLLKGFNVQAEANNKSQTTTVNFKAANAANTLDYVVLKPLVGGDKTQISLDADKLIDVETTAYDSNGVVLAGQELSIAIDDASLLNGVSLTQSRVLTVGTGKAKFSIRVSPQNEAELNALLTNGITVTVTASRADGTIYTVQRKLQLEKVEVEQVSKAAYLAIDPIFTSYDYTQDHSIQVRVRALDKDGGALENELVNLASFDSAEKNILGELSAKYNLTLTGSATQSTGADGYATFSFEYKHNEASSEQEKITEKAITLTAQISNKTTVKQVSTLNFKKPVAANTVTLDYLTVNTDGTVFVERNSQSKILVRVKAVDTNGNPFKQRVSIGLDSTTLDNGVAYVSDRSKETDAATGETTFELLANPNNATELESLISNGITVAVTATREDSTQYTTLRKIEVTKEAQTPVSYLLVDPISSVNATQNQTIAVRVKAVGKDSAALVGKAVTLSSDFVSKYNLLNLSLIEDSATQVTDSTGYATFTFDYKYTGTSTQLTTLVKDGLELTFSSGGKDQVTNIDFNTPQADAVAVDHLSIETIGSKAIDLGANTDIEVKVKAVGVDGGNLEGQSINLALNNAQTDGIEFIGNSIQKVAADGYATFNLSVHPKNATELQNLLNNGLTLTATATGSSYQAVRKIELVKPEVNSQVTRLVADPIQTSFVRTTDQTIQVKVRALAADGSALANEKVTIGGDVAQWVGLNFSLTGAASQITDEEGYATFNFSYKYANTSAQNSLSSIALTANAGTAPEQAITINFKAADTVTTLDYMVLNTVGAVDFIKVGTDKLIDVEAYAYNSAGTALGDQVVSIEIDETARLNGASLTATTATTDSTGLAKFAVRVNPQNATELNNLLANGVKVTVNATRADGSIYSTQRTLALAALVETPVSQVAYLAIDPIATSYDYTKDHSIQIRVKALDAEGGTLTNEEVSLTTAIQAQLASYNLTLTGSAKQLTGTDGYATFTFDYKYNENSTTQVNLTTAPILVTATANGKPAQTYLNFVKPPVNVDVPVLNYLIVDTDGTLEVKKNTANQDFAIRVTAIGSDDLAFAGQKVSVGLDQTAIDNGVSAINIVSKNTDINGNATFAFTANPKNDAELAALVANGITVVVTATAADGSISRAVRTIQVTQEAAATVAVDSLVIDPISMVDYRQDQTIAVRVKALNDEGGVLAGKKVKLTTNIQDKLNDLKLSLTGAAEVETDANGVATFIFDYKYAGTTTQFDLAQAGVVLTATSGSKTQVANIQFNTAVDAVAVDHLSIETIGSKAIDLGANTPIEVKVKAVGVDGGNLEGQSINLALNNAQTDGIEFIGGSSAKVAADGYATFNLSVHPKNATELQNLLNNGLTLTATATGSSYQAVRKIELVKPEVNSQVETLAIDPILNSFDYKQDHSIQVKVKALDADGGALANEKVAITTSVQAQLAALNFSLTGAASQITGADGYATFTFEYKYSGQPAQEDLVNGTINGIQVTASANGKPQTITLNFREPLSSESLDYITLDTDGYAPIEENVQTDIKVKVKAINIGGNALANQDVTISYNEFAHQQGLYLLDTTGATVAAQTFTVKTDANGEAIFTFKALPRNKGEVERLIKDAFYDSQEGDLHFTISSKREDGSVYEAYRRIDLRAPAAESIPASLIMDPISGSVDYTIPEQKISVRVRALSADGGALQGARVNIATALSLVELEKLHLALTDEAAKYTDGEGYATFTFDYKYAGTPEQNALPANPVIVNITTSNGLEATDRIQFRNPTTILDYFTLTTSTAAEEIAVGSPKTVTVTVDAKDTADAVLGGQSVSIGLNEAALGNGVSLTSPSTAITNVSGQATFQIQIDPKNATEVENLDANDLTISVIGQRADGSQYTAVRKIELTKPPVTLPTLAGLQFEYWDANADSGAGAWSGSQPISVLGGETRVRVTALDNTTPTGKPIANTPLAIGLSSLTSSRASLSNVPTTTNSKGEAEFTVTVSEGEYDANLVKNGITFAVLGTNLNNGDRIQQTGNIQVTVPANALEPRLSSDVKAITIGQTTQVKVGVKDELGIYQAGAPVRLALNADAVAAGVTLAHETIVAVANGTVSVDLVIPKTMTSAQKTALLASGIQVTGTIKGGTGVDITATLDFDVQDAVNPYHLSIDSSRVSLSSAGDTALVTVKLLDSGEGGVANQPVTLAIEDPRNATSINGGSQITTNEYGEAVFEVAMKSTDLSASTDPIKLTATHTDENGAVITQLSQMQVHAPTTLAPQLDLKLKASKDKLNVRGDAVDVSVLVTDMDGSSQSGKAVTLTIPEYQSNGAYIRGASTLESDENGWVTFTVVIDEALRTAGYDFITEDLEVEAVVKDSQNTERRQSFVMDVIASEVPNTQGAIAVTMNPTTISESEDGVYYFWNASAQVTDLDGRPVADQNVTLDIRAVEYYRGYWTPTPAVDPEEWAQVVTEQCTVSTVDLPATTYDDRYETMDSDYDRIESLNIVRFIGASESNPYTATYQTDREGKFDFQLRYPKTYGAWVRVNVGAKATLSSYPIHGSRVITLTTLAGDFDKSNWAYTPSLNNTSPYGVVPTGAVGCL